MKTINFILAGIFALALCTPWGYAGVYSWTDKNGVRHSSDLSPSEYMKQKKEASPQVEEDLPPEVTQTLFDKKGKPAGPETDANTTQIAPEAKIDQTVKPPPKSETPSKIEKSAAPLNPEVVETQPKKVVPPPAPTPEPTPAVTKPPQKKPVSFYKNQLARLKELIKSQEELIAEDVRTIGLIENRIIHIKNIQGPKSDRLKNELQESKKSLQAAKNRLKSDVRELQVLQSNVNTCQLKLKSAQ